MRLRRKPWIAEAIKAYEGIIATTRPGGGWCAEFGRTAPLHVELGTGKGGFLSELAARDPAADFIGVEAERDILFYAAKKVAERELANVRLLHFDVAGITEIFSPGEVFRLYINFCDPWPKKRHAKRRLTHRGFLEKYRVILAAGGSLFFKTDNKPLFEFSLEEFAAIGLEAREVTYDLHAGRPAGNIMTEYEAKFSALGTKICRCEVFFP